MKSVIFIILILAASIMIFGQSLTNFRAKQEDKKIIVTYDLSGSSQIQSYTIQLLVSEDGMYSWKGPLTAVTGDVGFGITTGSSKQIVWDVLSEPGRDKLKGDRISFKLRCVFTKASSDIPKTSSNELKESLPLELDNSFNAIVQAARQGDMSEADNIVKRILQYFVDSDSPVLIILNQNGSNTDYDRPTTIGRFINRLKTEKKNLYKVDSYQQNRDGKINELGLILKNLR